MTEKIGKTRKRWCGDRGRITGPLQPYRHEILLEAKTRFKDFYTSYSTAVFGRDFHLEYWKCTQQEALLQGYVRCLRQVVG